MILKEVAQAKSDTRRDFEILNSNGAVKCRVCFRLDESYEDYVISYFHKTTAYSIEYILNDIICSVESTKKLTFTLLGNTFILNYILVCNSDAMHCLLEKLRNHLLK